MSQNILSAADSNTIIKAKQLLQAGKLVCIPTETVYGLAANALDTTAVGKIFALKDRPQNNPLIVHIGRLEQLEQVSTYQELPLVKKRLDALLNLWPGPLSLLLPKKTVVPDLVTAGSNLVAVRMPSHASTLALLAACDFPLAAPSANKFTEISPTTAQHCQESFADKVDLIIDGGCCSGGVESTVLNITSEIVTIMRPGLITKEQLEALLNEPVNYYVAEENSNTKRISPGQHHKHYAPKTPLKLLKDYDFSRACGKVGVILFAPKMAFPKSFCLEKLTVLSQELDLLLVAQGLFAALRDMDQAKLDLILIDCCEEVGVGKAIMDRVNRALSKD